MRPLGSSFCGHLGATTSSIPLGWILIPRHCLLPLAALQDVPHIQMSLPRPSPQGCGPKGGVIITDMDQIEKSNLSRQFLFRNHHIKMPKSRVAAEQARLGFPLDE